MNNVYKNTMLSLERHLIASSPKVLSTYNSETQPASPIKGQTWYQPSVGITKEYSGTAWVLLPKDHFVFDWDRHAQIFELPNKHLLGHSSFSMKDMSKMYEGEFLLLISTFQDPNLTVLRNALNYFFDVFATDNEFPLFDMVNNTGQKGIVKIMEGTEIIPPVATDQRPTQGISISFAVNA